MVSSWSAHSPVPLAFPLLIFDKILLQTNTFRHVVRLERPRAWPIARVTLPPLIATEGGPVLLHYLRADSFLSALSTKENKSPWYSARDGWCQAFTTPAPGLGRVICDLPRNFLWGRRRGNRLLSSICIWSPKTKGRGSQFSQAFCALVISRILGACHFWCLI